MGSHTFGDALVLPCATAAPIMRLVEYASIERGGQYTSLAPEVLPLRGIFSELFLNAAMSSRIKHLYEFGPFRLDPSEHTLLRDGQFVPLRPKVFDMLLVLVENSGRLVEKDELMQAVWPDQFVEEGNLSKNISMLRHALGESPAAHSYIETVPKRGYRFVADLRAVNGDRVTEFVFETHTRASLVVEEETDDTPQTWDSEARVADADVVKLVSPSPAAVSTQFAGKFERRLKNRAPAAAVIAAVIIVLAAIVYLLYPARGGEAIDSVAVLPFINVSGDPEAEYLSDGISESIINSLSKLQGLKVIARSSSFKYKGKDADLQEVANALGVKAILIGRVEQRGENLLISVELVDARNKTQVWGEQSYRKAADLLAVQSEISSEIAQRLRVRLTSGEQQQLARRESADPVAYELLLKGRFYSNKATESQKKAIEYFNQAIAVDPTYALAYADLSFIYSNLVNSNVLDPKEFMPKAEMAARKALELDGSLAEAHLAMADINTDAWDWAAAEQEYKRAIELNPNLAAAHRSYAFYLNIQGRREQAIPEMKRARELDPLAGGANVAAVYELALARQNDQATEAAKKLLELDQSNPNLHTLLGVTYARKGQYREAITAYQEAIKLGDDSQDTQIYLGVAYVKTGEREKTRAILKRLETGKEYVSPMGLAMLHVTLGEREQAFTLLERAYSAHDQQLIWLGVERGFDPLRSDPHFKDLMRRVGLTP
jgi:TolB-like protein/DNA-binding winged helix-turn-helix (wHTH) protein/lipopolysaccharide biosynthesis regulator YciM